MKKVNFTKTHMEELKEKYVSLSFSAKVLSGKFAANKLSPYDLLHNTAIDTLIGLRGQLKKEIEAFESDHDEFTATEFQNRQNSEKKVWERYLYLLIGYKRYLAQKANDKRKSAELDAEIKKLEEENMTPKEKIKALKAKKDELSGLDDDLTEDFTAELG